MATVTDAVASGRFVSVELLPPRTPAGEETLRAALDDLAPLAPAFVAVTYGANGSDRGRTESLVKQLAGTAATAVPHLTCAAHLRMELTRLLTRYRAMGIDNVLALHGDPPLAADTALPEGELRYALDLVRLARERGIACVGVAVHPEGHPAAESRDADLGHQANKLRHADFAITQFVNRADDYFRFVDEMLKRGADAPVIPGIRPISNLRQAHRMAAMSGAAIPAALADQLTAAAHDPDQAFRIGVDYAVTVCERLLEGGAPGLHFFTMNRATSTLHVCEQLGWTAISHL
jgi:methylenetetrahydrofolate reductase (NADPH)